MSDRFAYKCPSCGTTNRLHEQGCKYDYEALRQFEKAYIDIISILLDYEATMASYDLERGMPKSLLVEKVEDITDHSKEPSDEMSELADLESVSAEDLAADENVEHPTVSWDEVHQDCFQRLCNERRILHTNEGLILASQEERADQIIPNFEPLQTIWECGPVDGCKDYAVYTMMSWCSLKELNWEQTCNFMHEWLEESGAWSRESWGESNIQQLIDAKKHVWSGDLGWGDYAEIAKNEIESRDIEPQLDADAKHGAKAEDYGDDA